MEEILITDNFTLVFMLLSLALLVIVVIYITVMNKQSEKSDRIKKLHNADLKTAGNGDKYIKP